MSVLEAYAYVRPTPTSFWSWGDEGRVLLWADGRTVAFLPEVHAAAQRLRSVGLPPFGSMVLALAGMRDTWAADESQRSALTGYVKTALSPGGELPGIIQDLLRDACARLDALAALPEELRKGAEARALLVEMLFEGVPPMVKPASMGPLIEMLAQRVPDLATDESPPPNLHAAEALAILKSLAAGRRLLDAEAIRLRQRTGLEQAPAAPEIHVSDLVRGLLNELRGDPQLGGLAKLARAVLAVIATPRRLVPETELPLGGVSDITNRGPLDRLLLTELAHDDLTLAVRVALNEALYLRRESPRSPQAFTRAVLLDCGIRLWGLPRVFSTAVGLAVAATTPKEASLTVWSAHRDTLIPVDLTTHDGLLAHLERLEPEPHNGAALPALAARLKEVPEQRSETILVTHPDAAADAEFQQAVQAAELYPYLLATVAGSGRFALEACSSAGRKPLAEAVLKLNDILAAPAEQPPLVDARDDLPAFFRLPSSPFHLPVTADLRHAVSSPRHGLVALSLRTLMYWPALGRAHKFRAAAPLPSGTFVGLGIFEDEAAAVALIWEPVDKVLHCAVADLKSHQLVPRRIFGLPAEPLGVGGHRGCILILHSGRVAAYSLNLCVHIASKTFPAEYRIVGARFLQRPDGTVLAIACDGTGIQLIDVPLAPAPIAVFDRIGVEGPLALYPDGSVRNSAGEMLVPPAALVRPLLRFSCRVSNNGTRLIADFLCPTDAVAHCLDLAAPHPKWQPLGKVNRDRFLLGPQADFAVDRRISLRRHIQGICVNRANNLTLISRRNKAVVLAAAVPRLVPAGRYAGDAKHYLSFKELGTPAASATGLLVAEWPDGSRAWMDRRGILHLRSSDPAIPELSVLLADASASMTAWTSDGKTYGWEQYLTEPPTGKPSGLIMHLCAFVGRLG